MLDDPSKQARQLKQPKAHSTAYLSQQISQLESKIGDVSLKDKNRSHAVARDDDDFPPLGAEVVAKPKRPAQEPAPAGHGDVHIDGSDADSAAQENGDDKAKGAQKQWKQRKVRAPRRDDGSQGEEDEEEVAWRVVVLDTAALLWAPQAVRRLVRQGIEVVVPMEVIRTLDMLKTGSSPSAKAARSATRYIEHVTRQFKPLSADPAVAVKPSTGYKRGRGLRLQADVEDRDPESVSTLPIPAGDTEVLPKWIEHVLGCAAYFMTIASAESEWEGSATLMVANPPLSVEIKEGDTGSIGKRGEGYAISEGAERFEIPIEVLRDEEDDEMPETEKKAKNKNVRNGSRSQNGRGRGPATGGKRGKKEGMEKEPSPEREVKILLRRPVEPDDVHLSPTIPAPQLSSPSTANRSPLLSNGQLSSPAPAAPMPRSPHLPPPPMLARPPPHAFARPPPPMGRPPGPPPGPGHRPPPSPGGRGGFSRPSPDDHRGRGRGRGRGGGSRGAPRGGDFVLLQRPGPPLATYANGFAPPRPVAAPHPQREAPVERGGPKVVLLQRPK